MKASMAKYNIEIMQSNSELEKIKEALKLGIKDSPFAEFIPNDKALDALIQSYCQDNSNGERFLAVLYNQEDVVGLVGATLLSDHFLFTDYRVAQEIVWWVHPDARKDGVGNGLLDVLEHWAKTMGVKHLLVGHYENEHTDLLRSIYEKRGFKVKEYNYMKEIS